MTAYRLPSESLICYMIRLEVMAGKIPHVDSLHRQTLTRVKFLNSLSDDVVRHINAQISYLDSVSNEQILRLAVDLEHQEATCKVAVKESNQQQLVHLNLVPTKATPKIIKTCQVF